MPPSYRAPNRPRRLDAAPRPALHAGRAVGRVAHGVRPLSLVAGALVACIGAASAQAQTSAGAPPTRWAVLEAEHLRSENLSLLERAIASSDTAVQRIAIRAVGRFERPALAPLVQRALTSPHAVIRREAVQALGQMNAAFDFAAAVRGESDAAVRAAAYEAMGRQPQPRPGTDETLAAGLADDALETRAGAARGLESLLRRTARTSRPSSTTIVALQSALADQRNAGTSPPAAELRELALLALTAAGNRDSATFDIGLRDPSEQVRRVAVAGARRWIDDRSPNVRIQALRSAGDCARFRTAITDADEMTRLVALDLMGERSCNDAASIDALVSIAKRMSTIPAAGSLGSSEVGSAWRAPAHAIASLAKVSPGSAQPYVAALAASRVWQARAWGANAATTLKDSATLARLARDTNPNVVVAAMRTDADITFALRSSHAGLVLTAAERLKGSASLGAMIPAMTAALDRFTATGRSSLRDPRAAILQRFIEADSLPAATMRTVRALLADRDPAIAALAARAGSKRGAALSATTTRYRPAAMPSAATLSALDGATAEIRMRGAGTMRLALHLDEAPVTVATFAALADGRKYDGLTFHRIVPNFVVQGASPGADEYDPLSDTFMRDEVGLIRNARGTFGISTRGRDTGDAQIYINLVDNFRLDHDYTVFAHITAGLDVMDRIGEGDVIESVRIVRTARTTPK